MRLALQLTIEISAEDLFAGDLSEAAKLWAVKGEEPTSEHYLEVILHEWMREEVTVTVVTLPGEKGMANDFDIYPYRARIVGAGVREVD